MTPFDYVRAINEKKEVSDYSQYVPFIINKAFSYFKDSILHANEMNLYTNIPVKNQFSFFINSLSKAKRFSKWSKPETVDDLEAISLYFGYNRTKTKEVLRLLTKEQIELIKKEIKEIQNG